MKEAQAQGCLIGLVDDHPINRYVLSRQLSLLGYTSVVAEDGEQALAMTHQYKLALLITDCQMPRMDGYQPAQAIHPKEALEGRAPCPSWPARRSPARRSRKCQAAGMSDYMTKPLPVPVLAAMLKKWGHRRPTHRTPKLTLRHPMAVRIDLVYWGAANRWEDELKAMLADQFITTTRHDAERLQSSLSRTWKPQVQWLTASKERLLPWGARPGQTVRRAGNTLP